MGPLGIPEMMALFVLALLLFGPKKLPELGRTLGKGLSEFRRAKDELKATFDSHMREIEHETQHESYRASSYAPSRPVLPTHYDSDYHAQEAEGSSEPHRELTSEQQAAVRENAEAANPAPFGVSAIADTVPRSNGYHSVHAGRHEGLAHSGEESQS